MDSMASVGTDSLPGASARVSRRIASAELVDLFNGQDSDGARTNLVVIIDVRGFMSYNKSHIIKAHNPSLPPAKMLKRRGVADPSGGLKKYFPPDLQDEVSNGHDNLSRAIVVYDADGANGETGRETVLQIAVQCLLEETQCTILELEGGFNAFMAEYPGMCEPVKSTGVCSVCETSVDRCRCGGGERQRLVSEPMSAPPVMSPKKQLSFPHLKLNVSGVRAVSQPLCTFAPGMVLSPIPGGQSPHAVSDSGLGEDRMPSEILPYLFLGSCLHSSDLELLQRQGITHVLNISMTCPCHFQDKFIYRQIKVEDSLHSRLDHHFEDCANLIESVGNCGGKILVHCYAGISRSATVCIAYIMKFRKLSFNDARIFVRQRRACIEPNVSFMGQLLAYQEKLQNGQSSQPSFEASAPFFAINQEAKKSPDLSCHVST